LAGDVISAVASTFEVRFQHYRRVLSGRSVKKVENAILMLADDYNVWSFDGQDTTKLTHLEKLEDFINPYRQFLDKAVATYFNNYYMLSFVENGHTTNNLELYWDAIENKCDFVRDRNASCYLEIDRTIENNFQQIGSSNFGYTLYTEQGYNFDGVAINTRLWTKDITPSKGKNVRFYAFTPELQPGMDISPDHFTMIYTLDGRITDLDNKAKWEQSNLGEVKTIGMVSIQNQNQVIGRMRPKINYSKGTSIAFYINYIALNKRIELLGIGAQFIERPLKKSRKVGA